MFPWIVYKYLKAVYFQCTTVLSVIWHLSHCLAVTTCIFNRNTNCDVRVWHDKTRDFIIDWTIYWVRLFEVSEFEPKMGFFNLQISGKLTGLSNQFEPSIVFDRSKFDLAKFDCIFCRFYVSSLLDIIVKIV